MSGVLLKGWNLQGRLPSVSSLTSKGGFVALAGQIPYQPGQLLRVPNVIYLVNAVSLTVIGTDSHGYPIYGYADPGIEQVLIDVRDRIASGMPDAIVVSGTDQSLVLGYSNPFSWLPWNAVSNGAPCVGCSFICICIGNPLAFRYSSAGTTATEATQAIAGTIPHFQSYASRVFLDQYGLAGGVLVPLIASQAQAGIDVSVAGSSADVTSDSVSAIISDYFGVQI